MARPSGKPGRDCPRCPRLVAFRSAWREREPDWFNAPVPSFGPIDARLLIVGLAPGLRGANRTGRPFTGDYAGDLLYATLKEFGFARRELRSAARRRLTLIDCRITNAVRCVPPENKPTPQEIATCRELSRRDDRGDAAGFAPSSRSAASRTTRVIAALEARRADYPFAHGGAQAIGAITLFDSYHCSRYNTNTGVLTPQMFRDVFARVRAHLDVSEHASWPRPRGRLIRARCSRSGKIAASYSPLPISLRGKMPCCSIHSNDSSNVSFEYGSNTSRSPGPQRRVSIWSWKRTGNSFL